ncbi:MAG: hypothetical protein CML68_16125 [Rhodobacteraceae bacterium]|nr:hypothetical protein [Paracoccaceae bacterium]
MKGLTLPPLMSAEEVAGDPLAAACARAQEGCDAGLMCWTIAPTRIEAALVFAPEVSLSRAMEMLPLCGVGLQNALGALSPPEVAVQLGWDGTIFVNGARCGALRVRASDSDAGQVPDWLVIGMSLRLSLGAVDPGATPDDTALAEEGCADIPPDLLLEAWARHTLNWIGRWETDGAQPLYAEWRGLVPDLGTTVTRDGRAGTFLGVDESFGMLLRGDDATHLIPLTTLLEPVT